MRKAANDDALTLWPAEAQVYVMQTRSILSKVETALVKQDDSLRYVVEDLENSIRRLRRAIRIVSKGLR